MSFGGCQHFAKRRNARLGFAIDDGEVQVCRVAIVPEVYKPECRSALEHQTSCIRRGRPVKLGDYMREDVVAFSDECINPVCVGSLRDGMTREHDQCPTTARSSSAETFHVTRNL